MSYNGWTNKETWLVNLWLGDYFAELQDEGEAVTEEFIRETVEEMASAAGEEGMNGLITDLLNFALGEINYREIASYYVTEGESVQCLFT